MENYKNYNIKIMTEDYPYNPRENDNLGTIVYTSSRYTLGDERLDSDEITAINRNKNNICFPVYAYIHSGTSLSLDSFSCPWDSGQCGIIYISKEKLKKEYDYKIITKKRIAKLREYLAYELEEFNYYLNGDVYHYEVIKDGESLDACGGYFGDDHERSGLLSSAREFIDWHYSQSPQQLSFKFA